MLGILAIKNDQGIEPKIQEYSPHSNASILQTNELTTWFGYSRRDLIGLKHSS